MPAGFRFAEPIWLLMPALALLPWIWQRGRPRLAWPSVAELAADRAFRRGLRGWAPVLVRTAALLALGFSLARPQTVAGEERRVSSGVAIVLALDVSRSMATEHVGPSDEAPTRLDAARQVFERFVAGRPNDLLGLVRFANSADTACAPTLDHDFVLEMAASLMPARATEAGTNIGDALAWATRDVVATGARRKVVVLVTDGRNEPGVPNALDPAEAARLAAELGVVVHVVVIGGDGQPAVDMENGGNAGALSDLERVAAEGQGTLFSANESAELSRIFEEINRLERSEVAALQRTRYREWRPPLVGAALGLIALEAVMRIGRWRRWPG
jgi:Ca-activated chloride channel family protein